MEVVLEFKLTIKNISDPPPKGGFFIDVTMDRKRNIKDLWGTVAFENWALVSFIKGRIAKEEDIESGCAVFSIDNSENHIPLEILLPSLANHINEETGEKKLVIVIQGEKANEQELVGFRYFEGGNAVCMLHEIEFI